MRRRGLRWLAPAVYAALAGLLWTLVPAPFARGLVVGAFGVPLVLFGVFAVFAKRMQERMGELHPPAIPRARWDYALEAEDLEGRSVPFSAFRGSVLIVNVWGTWCGPCVREMPSLLALRDATADLGVRLACLTEEEPRHVADFLRARELDVPAFAVRGGLPEPFRTRAIPATWILDRNGVVALQHRGAARWDDAAVVTFVRGLAATPSD